MAFGGGVNSVAVLVWLARAGLKPHAILMADPGSEHAHTVRYRDEILPAWLAAQGFPAVTTTTRIREGEALQAEAEAKGTTSRIWRLETLEGECLRTQALPSVAYGWKKCSAKYKGDTSRWWAKRQPWLADAWASGQRAIKIIGYDASEQRRARPAFQDPWESVRFVPWYPLIEAGLDRDDCETLIAEAGLPLPGKSACTFCPHNTMAEWEALRRDEPDAFARAVEMSRNAEPMITAPDAVGLMRAAPHGRRQLHVWADGGYDEADAREHGEDAVPCECAL